MSFLRLDDSVLAMDRLWPLSDQAFRLHLSGLLFCSRHRTDGFVPATRMKSLVPRYKPKVLAELVQWKLWLPPTETMPDYEIVGYLDLNPSAEQIRNRRDKNATRAQDRRVWAPVVFERDGGRCTRCGSTDITLDHVVPLAVSLEPRTSLDDFATLCQPCNSSKGAR